MSYLERLRDLEELLAPVLRAGRQGRRQPLARQSAPSEVPAEATGIGYAASSQPQRGGA